MKKFILIAGLLFCGIAQAQIITVTGNNGQPITDGYEFTTNSLSLFGTAKLYIRATNQTNAPIHLKLRLDSMENANGNSEFVQFCFDSECYFSVQPGNTVPSAVTGATLAPGQSNNSQDHFANGYAGDTPGLPVVYNLSIIQLNPDGSIIGPLMSFSYRYQPTAGTTDFNSLQSIGVNIKNTVVTNVLDIDVKENVKMELFNINGQVVKTSVIRNGAQSLDLSGLAAAVYIARFTTENNKTAQVRIIKN